MQEVSDSFSLERSSVVDGTYRIEAPVARGGFSTMYRARHVEMDRRVALKVLELEGNVDAGALERFSQEARLACQLNHPNIVTIYQFGQDERGLLYIAMEWVDGPALADAIEDGGPLSAPRVARLGRQIAAGLTAVHDRDVLHRDLKPSNVMLMELTDGDEIAKLLDFGVAKPIATEGDENLRITQEGKFVGTPRYASPEQIRGEELNPRTDIYGVGLLMWEALTGEPAVSSVDFEKCCAQHLSGKPWRIPDEIQVPAPLAHVIHRSLKKAPQQRFSSCRELKEALTQVLRELPEEESDDRPSIGTEAASKSSYYTITGSGWMELIFAVLVGGAVLALVGYQVWLTVYEEEAGEQRPAAVQKVVESPDDLVDALGRRNWKVEGSTKVDSDSTRWELSSNGERARITIHRSSKKGAIQEGGLRFADFAVQVKRSAADEPATRDRLLGDLYQIRAAATTDSGKAEGRGQKAEGKRQKAE